MLKFYFWESDIGRAMAVASTVQEARELVMRELADNDAAREELRNMLAAEPEVVTDKPVAAIAWHP